MLAFVRFSQLGLRQAFDKPVVLVQESGSEPIFDITPLRITAYRREMLCREVLEDQEEAAAVIATREAALDAKSVNSIVRLLGLTHSASLPAVAEGDEVKALLTVIMSEIGNVTSDVALLRQLPRYVDERIPDITPTASAENRSAPAGASYIRDMRLRVQREGLANGLAARFKIPGWEVRLTLKESRNLKDFLTSLHRYITPFERVILMSVAADAVVFPARSDRYEKERSDLLTAEAQAVPSPEESDG